MIYMDQNRLSLIGPAFNEEKTIANVLDRIFSFLPDVHEVLVIDDGSTRWSLQESITLRLWLEHLGLELPPASTLSDNLNAVSNQTRSLA
jgi:hypothetical protein